MTNSIPRNMVIGLGYQTQVSTQLPFLFRDGAFSCLWQQRISENSYEPHILFFSHCPVTRLLNSVTYIYIQYLTLVIMR